MLKNRLRILMAERRLRVKDVVQSTGISRNTISHIKNNPTASIATKTQDILMNYLEVTPDGFWEYKREVIE